MRIISSFPQYRPSWRHLAAVPAGSLMLAGALTMSALPAASQVQAQAPQCGAREAVLERLSDKYDERPVSIGVTATGSLLEVLASPEGSWTIVVTVPNGPTCLVSSGDGWHSAPVQIAEDPRV
ncbi:MAG: hypothetical protein ACFCUW_13190 [Kiloniellaceae bacterium]